MLKHIIGLLFLGISFSCFAQRPLPVEKLQPIMDSIQIEAGVLFASEMSTKTALRLAKKKKIVFERMLTYQSKDSTFVLFLNKENKCLREYCFLKNYTNPRSTSARLRSLTKVESKRFELQQNLIQKAMILSNDSIQAIKDYDLHTLLIPSHNKSHLYLLTATEQDSIYPSGNDYLFIFNQDQELEEQVYLKFHKYSILKSDQDFEYKLTRISYPLGIKEGLLPLAIYICKFRIYDQNIGLSEFRANWNKRFFSYGSIENKVNIELFYTEKLSPQYRNKK